MTSVEHYPLNQCTRCCLVFWGGLLTVGGSVSLTLIVCSWDSFSPVGLLCSTSVWQLLVVLLFFVMLACYFLGVCSLLKAGGGVDLEGDCGGELGTVERGENVGRIYCMSKDFISNKIKFANWRKTFKSSHTTGEILKELTEKKSFFFTTKKIIFSYASTIC